MIAAYLLVEGMGIRSDYAAFLSCAPAKSSTCQSLWEAFRTGHGESGRLGPLLPLLPPIVGILAGTSILGREIETGTFRYAWTQSVGRTRWATAMLVSGAAAVTVIGAAFGALALWHNEAFAAAGTSAAMGSLVFPATGVAAAGWALLGFSLGALTGLACARVVPAIVASLVSWFVLAYVASDLLRPNYVEPVTGAIDTLGNGDMLIDVAWFKSGVRVSEAEIDAVLQSAGGVLSAADTSQSVPSANAGLDMGTYLMRHGYEQLATYRPASDFWKMQSIEFGWLALLAIALLGATLWLVKRRPR